jgi:hypothetical protein
LYPIFKEKIQLSGYSAYPDGSTFQLIHITGVLLHNVIVHIEELNGTTEYMTV